MAGGKQQTAPSLIFFPMQLLSSWQPAIMVRFLECTTAGCSVSVDFPT